MGVAWRSSIEIESLKVRNHGAAEAAKNLVELTIHRLVTGQIVVPETVDVGDFILSGGALRESIDASRPEPKPEKPSKKGRFGYEALMRHRRPIIGPPVKSRFDVTRYYRRWDLNPHSREGTGF